MSNVAYLENSDFTREGKLLIDEPVLCLIYANWCPPCVAFKPEFYKFAEQSPIAVACIEMDGHLPGQKELTDRVNFIVPELQGTPTVVVFVNGRVAEKYLGDRTASALMKFAQKYSR
jgi:thiol-disulfide isomerase/thioredoxin